MASINAVIVPGKALKNGQHKIRISVAHNGETRYIVTDVVVDSIKEFKNGAVVKRSDAAYMNTKIRGILQKYQDMIDDMQYVNGLTCAELVTQLKHGSYCKHPTLGYIFDEFMSNANIKESTVKHYNTIWATITAHLPPSLLVENVSPATIIGVDRYLRNRNLRHGTIKVYMAFLMVVIGYAKKCGYVHFSVNPFMTYKLPPKSIRQSWLSVDEVRLIRDFECPTAKLKECRDLFMLSYYLGGINIVDLINIDFNTNSQVIRYIRKKTENLPKMNKYVEFSIPDEAKEIINLYKGKDGRIQISRGRHSLKNIGVFVSRTMRELANATGINQLVYYSARKSFSQHAFDLKITPPVIDYILGHKVDKNDASLYSYIRVTPEMATDAVRMVLDNLK